MNKIGAATEVLVAAIVGFSLWGCGGDGEKAAVLTPPPTATVAPAPIPGVPSGALLFLAYGNHEWDNYRANADGSGTVDLADLPSSDFPAGWSPDRTKYAYSAPGQEGVPYHDVYVIDPVGSKPRNLTNSDASEGFISWSPDSTRILFRTFSLAAEDYWIINADGTNPVQIVGESWYCGDPDWSPDGKRLLISERKESEGNCTLYVADENGGNRTAFDKLSASAFYPKWSPDGRRILFLSRQDSHQGGVFVMNTDGSDVRSIYDGPLSDWHYESPTWSPDGTRIAIGAGTELITVAYGAEISYPAWSPDGGRIAYISQHEDEARLYVVGAEGGAAVSVSQGAVTVLRVCWSYDGRLLLFASDRKRLNGVYWMTLDGSKLERIEELSQGEINPEDPGPPSAPGCRQGEPESDQGCLSPDGSTRAFLSQEEDGFWVNIRATVSGDAKRIVNVGRRICGEVGAAFLWSPDGAYLYYTKGAIKGEGCAPGFLYRVRPDGTGEEQLADLRVGALYGFAP